MTQEIKNIIFDLGGVIINLDYYRTIDALNGLSSQDISSLFSDTSYPDFIVKYEKGLISSGEFREKMRVELKLQATDNQIDTAWNAMLLDIPKERIKLVEALSKRFRLFVLSNTNEIHKKAFDQIVYETFEKNSLEDLFEKAHYSFEMKLNKPEKAIFERVLAENKLKAKQTFFIDDTLVHTQAAQEIGIFAYHLQKPETILDVFYNFEATF